jgi:hypothetical protein
MSTLQQNWRKGQNRFCLESEDSEGEKEGLGSRGQKCKKDKNRIKKRSNIRKE